MEQIEFLSAILIISEDPARLATFYRDVVGIPLKDEGHGQSLPHYGCTLGDLHFAIHPIETFPDQRHGVGAVKLALNIFDIQGLVKRLEANGVKVLYPPTDMGFFISTAINHPDGNFIESRRCATTGSSCWRRTGNRVSMWSRVGSPHASRRSERVPSEIKGNPAFQIRTFSRELGQRQRHRPRARYAALALVLSPSLSPTGFPGAKAISP
jgi:predicted enzyme related to lactoylglutathione lyase